jgi:hypothetical protein
MRTRTLGGWFVIPFALWIGGCSEEPARPTDPVPPEARILYPFSRAPRLYLVADSIDVYVGARDLGAGGAPGTISEVAFYFIQPDAGEPTRIGVVSTPIPPLGTPIHSETQVRLFVLATDAAGNSGRSAEDFRILVMNSCDDLGCLPMAIFTVAPQMGTVETEFVFDPTDTRDPAGPDEEVRVRWDFDGDPESGWDIDWSERTTAAQVVRHRFASPGIYAIRMQARITYLPDSIVEAPPRIVRVLPARGFRTPDP